MLNLDKHKALTEFINSWLKIITVFAAGIFTLTEYFDHKEGEQIKRTLSYVERYSSSKMLDIRNKLESKLDVENPEIIKTLSDATLTQAELGEKFSLLMLEIIKSHNLSIDLKTLIDFHEEVVLCVSSKLCDEQVARDFFSTDAKELFRGFYPYLCQERTKWKNDRIGSRFEKFYNPTRSDVC